MEVQSAARISGVPGAGGEAQNTGQAAGSRHALPGPEGELGRLRRELGGSPGALEAFAGSRGQQSRPSRIALIAGLIGIVITVSVSWTAWRLDRSNEHRLLQLQCRQAAEVLSTAILTVEDPLQTALQVSSATGGSAAQFRRFMSLYIGPNRPFASASLWRKDGPSVRLVASTGTPAELAPASVAAHRFVASALNSATFVVKGIKSSHLRAIGYAVANPNSSSFVVYAERTIPATRRVSAESGSAFSDLDFVTYLGRSPRLSELTTSNVPLDRLPLSGDTASVTIPFGNTAITLVAAPTGPLGGSLSAELAWIFFVSGMLVTVASAVVAGQLVTRRAEAERNARTIAALYNDLDNLFGEQRTIAQQLQQAILPRVTPKVPGLEVAVRYVPGAGRRHRRGLVQRHSTR